MQRILFFCICAFTIMANAQTTFQAVYGTNAYEFSPSVETTAQGGYAMAAATNENDFNNNIIVWITDPTGDTLWTREYNIGAERLMDMKCTSDGGFILCGHSRDVVGPGTWNVLLLKIDSVGTIQWYTYYGINQTSNEYPREIIQTSDNGFAVVGGVDSAWSSPKAFVLKADQNGGMEWIKRYDFSFNYTELTSIVEATNGDLVAAGLGYKNGRPCMMAMRIDSASNLLWCHKYNGYSSFVPYSVLEYTGGDLFLCGGTAEDSAHARVFISKLSASGNMLWTKIYDKGFFGCGFTKMIRTSTGEFAITGRGIWPIYDGFVLMSDTAGNVTSATQYLQNNSYYYEDITEAVDGGFAIAAGVQAYFSGQDTNSVTLIKTTSNLNAQCGINVYTMNEVQFVLTDSLRTPMEMNGSYTYLPTCSVYTGSNRSIICAVVGVKENLISEYSVYPNPASSEVAFETPNLHGGQLVIYNVAGEIVARESIVSDKTLLTIDHFAPGIYLYHVLYGEQLQGMGRIIKE